MTVLHKLRLTAVLSFAVALTGATVFAPPRALSSLSDPQVRFLTGSDPEEQLENTADCSVWNAFLEGLVSCYACETGDVVSTCLCCGRNGGVEVFYILDVNGAPPGLNIETQHPEFCGLAAVGTCNGHGGCGNTVLTGGDCDDVIEYWNQS